MPSPRLVPGTILRAIAGEAAAIGEFEVQVLQIAPLSGGRALVNISDSAYFVKAVTSSALYARVAALKRFQCVSLNASAVSVTRNAFTILDFNESHEMPAGMIGSPVDVSERLKTVPNNVAPTHSAPATMSGSYAPAVASRPPSAYSRDSKTKANNAEATPLALLDPYAGRFNIKVRVLAKSEMREYNSATGPGKLFSMEIIDNAQTTMRATAFRATAEKLFEQFQTGKCYTILDPQLRAVKESKWSRSGQELHLTQETIVTEAPDDLTIPRDNFKFVKIAAIANLPENASVDVCGIVTRLEHPQPVVMRKTSRSTTKRVVAIRDDSGKQIEVTIWGNHAETTIPPNANDLFKDQPIHSLSLGGAIVSGFDGRGLSTTANTRVVLDSSHPEAVQLRNWFAKLPAQVQSAEVESLTTRGVIAPGERRLWIVQVNEMRVDDGATEFAVVRANLKFSIEDERLPWYPGCTAIVQTTNGGRQCGKKMAPVAESMHGEFSCSESHISPPQMRYNLSVTLTDHSGHTFATAFEDQAKVLLEGSDAGTLSQMVQREPAKVRQLFERCSGRNWTVKLRLRAQPRLTQTGETTRVLRKDIVALNPLAYEKEQKQITAEYAAFKKQRETVAEVLALAPK